MSPILVPFGADWAETVSESRSALTSVLVSENGTEQRRLLRRVPRVTFEMTFTAENAKLAGEMQVLLLTAAGATVAAPAWQYGQELDVAVASGATVVPAEATFTPWSKWAMLYLEDGVAELVEIQSVGVGQLTLAAPLVSSWPRGAAIVPCFEAWVNSDASFRWIGRGVMRWRAGFTLLTTDYPQWATAVGVAAENMAVGEFPSRADTDSPVRLTRALRRFDNPYADVREQDPYAVITALGYEALFTDPAESAELWAWLDTRLGRLNPVWLPTFSEDLPLAASVTSVASTVTITDVGYAALHALDVSRRYLALVDGIDSFTVRKVSSVAPGAGLEVLTLAASAGIVLTLPYGYLSFAHYARLADDAVTVEWSAPWVGQSLLSFVDVPLEAP